MTVDEALADVHRHFCTADQHDDACVALHEATGRLANERQAADYWDR